MCQSRPPRGSRPPRRVLSSVTLGAVLLLLMSSACPQAAGKPLLFIPFNFATSSNVTSPLQVALSSILDSKVTVLTALASKYPVTGVSLASSSSTTTTTNTTNSSSG